MWELFGWFSHQVVTDSFVTWQAPLSVGFPRKEYWTGLPFPPPGDLSWSRDRTCVSCIDRWFFTAEPPGKLETSFDYNQIRVHDSLHVMTCVISHREKVVELELGFWISDSFMGVFQSTILPQVAAWKLEVQCSLEVKGVWMGSQFSKGREERWKEQEISFSTLGMGRSGQIEVQSPADLQVVGLDWFSCIWLHACSSALIRLLLEMPCARPAPRAALSPAA